MKEWTLLEFLKESNRIEGLPGPKIREIEAAEALLALTRMTVEALQVYVSIIAPDWIIVGGETNQGSHKARHAAPDWMRGMRDDAKHLGRKLFVKQMTNKGSIPADLMIRQYPFRSLAA